MTGERFVLHCPTCGKVSGVAPTTDPDDIDDVSSEDAIAEEVFESEAGPVSRVRCPRCGRWLNPDLAEPE